MQEDIKNIRISIEAEQKAKFIQEKYSFPNQVSVLRFAMAYALRDYKDKMDFELLDTQYPKDGSNYNTGSIDESDTVVRKLIQIMYPACETPYKYARVAIIFGLNKLYEKIQSDSNLDISELM